MYEITSQSFNQLLTWGLVVSYQCALLQLVSMQKMSFFFFFLSLNHIRVVQKNIWKMLCAPLCKSGVKKIKKNAALFYRFQPRTSFILSLSLLGSRAGREGVSSQLISHISAFLSTGVDVQCDRPNTRKALLHLTVLIYAALEKSLGITRESFQSRCQAIVSNPNPSFDISYECRVKRPF